MNEKIRAFSRLRLTMTGMQPDLVSALLFRYGCRGIEELSEDVWLVYFTEEQAGAIAARLYKELKTKFPAFQDDQFLLSRLENKDWNAEWKKHYHPLYIGGRTVVAPPWEKDVVKEGRHLVVIDPQMAFGTGSHATTQLIIKALEKYLKSGDFLLDAGTGSGILAIIAGKMGAARITAFDIEIDAVENARHNAKLNGINTVQWYVGQIPPAGKAVYHLITANINRLVLADMLPGLTDCVRPGGLLLLSGILHHEKKHIESAAPANLQFLEENRQDEWISLVYRRIN
ncbi:MAG: 50S ribosomal protein L11 methyltransferase [Calditrichia bacterium]